MNTKEKIIKESIIKFNQSGYGSVSLFELAQHLGISRGNLAYHFKDKEILLKAILDDMWTKIEVQRKKSRSLPSFENLNNEVQLYFKFQMKYAFVFTDSQVLRISYVNKRFKEMSKQTILDNKAAIAFAIQLGNMKEEPFPGIYNNIATNVWVLSFFWLAQNIVRGETKEKEGEKMIWSLLIPHFTEKGMHSFKKYFGEAYYQELGEPFELDIDSYMSF